MSVGFGFSAGDVVAGINLMRNLKKSLKDGAGASAEYCGIIRDLSTLEEAFQLIQQLHLDEPQSSHLSFFKLAVVRCRNSLDTFLTSILKYQPNLQAGGSSNQWRDKLEKVKWGICKKEDVQRFKADINEHISFITMLLISLHM